MDGRQLRPHAFALNAINQCLQAARMLANLYMYMYIFDMAKRYSIAEARSNLSSIVDQAEAGQEIELTRRGKPVAVVVSLRELILNDPGVAVEDIMTENVLYVHPELHQEEVAHTFQKYSFSALPVVDDHGRTSVPGVFAAGDATTVPYKQIVISMGEGSKASLAAFEYLLKEGDYLNAVYQGTEEPAKSQVA